MYQTFRIKRVQIQSDHGLQRNTMRHQISDTRKRQMKVFYVLLTPVLLFIHEETFLLLCQSIYKNSFAWCIERELRRSDKNRRVEHESWTQERLWPREILDKYREQYERRSISHSHQLLSGIALSQSWTGYFSMTRYSHAPQYSRVVSLFHQWFHFLQM